MADRTDTARREGSASDLYPLALLAGYKLMPTGYPAVDHCIPAEYITWIRTGYAEGVVTQDGDAY